MAQELIKVGLLPNDGKGDKARVAGIKINNNFTELYTGKANRISPDLLGTPTTPTPAQVPSQQIANMVAVLQAVADATGGSQPGSPVLDALALLTMAADKLPYFNSGGSAATTDLTALARQILAAPTLADVKAILAYAAGDIGLGNVDNTSDADKPISAAQQAVNAVQDAAIANLASENANQDTAIATIGTAVVGKVNRSGDAMEGPLFLDGDPTDPLHAATKAYVDASGGPAFIGFSAYKSGSGQNVPINTTADVVLPSESFDIGGHFANNKWTPPAGYVSVECLVRVSTPTNAAAHVQIRKNGNVLATTPFPDHRTLGSFPSDVACVLTAIDFANGADEYYVAVQSSSEVITIRAGEAYTRFHGRVIG